MSTIPLFKVFMAPEAPARVSETLRSGYIGTGPRVDEFEAALAAAWELPEPPLALTSCTAAIDLALHLCGVGPGSVVISTPMTCTATNTHLVLRGARIRWADVNPVTGLIDPYDVARKLTPDVRAIVAVDWGGAPCDYAALRALGVPVIQDAAHLPLPGHPRGDYTCYSFQAIKHLTTGDGGALLAPPEQMERARLLRWYGLDRRSKADFRADQRITEAGYKYALNDIAATIGLANLPHALPNIARARENAAYYDRELPSPWNSVAEAVWSLPRSAYREADRWHSHWLYTIHAADRAGFIAFMAGQGVACSPVHARNDAHPAFRAAQDTIWQPLPGVDRFAGSEVAIPVGWWVTDEQRERVAQAVRTWAYRAAVAG